MQACDSTEIEGLVVFGVDIEVLLEEMLGLFEIGLVVVGVFGFLHEVFGGGGGGWLLRLLEGLGVFAGAREEE